MIIRHEIDGRVRRGAVELAEAVEELSRRCTLRGMTCDHGRLQELLRSHDPAPAPIRLEFGC